VVNEKHSSMVCFAHTAQLTEHSTLFLAAYGFQSEGQKTSLAGPDALSFT
jgi:hypothetical protein